MMYIVITNLSKAYMNKRKSIDVLHNLNFKVDKGEFIAITGKSGCGKTTLLNILSGLDYPDTGRYIYNGNNIKFEDTSGLSFFRRKYIGFIPQGQSLLNNKSIYYNIALPLEFRSLQKNDIAEKVKNISASLDIQKHLNKMPKQLSMGECQRVAIARAIITDPQLILADEPTSSLDSETEEIITTQFKKLQSSGSTIITVTHNKSLAEKCDRIFNLEKPQSMK